MATSFQLRLLLCSSLLLGACGVEPTFDDGAATDDEEDSEDEDESEGDEDESDHEDDHADSDHKKKDAGQKKPTKKDAGSDASTGKKKPANDAGHASHGDGGTGFGEGEIPPSDGDGLSSGFDGGIHAGPDHAAPGGGPSLGDPTRDNGVSGGDITRAPVGRADGNTPSGPVTVLPPASGSSTDEPEELPTDHGDHGQPIVPPDPAANEPDLTPTPTPTPGNSGPTVVTPPSNSGRPSNVPPNLPPITPPASTSPSTHDHSDMNPPAVTPPTSGPRITEPVRDPTPPVVGPPAPPVAARDACDEELTYAAFGKGFFDAYCVGCHSGGQAPNLGSLSNIAAAKALVAMRAIQGVPRIMPPPGGPAPSADEKAKLQQWLNCSPLD